MRIDLGELRWQPTGPVRFPGRFGTRCVCCSAEAWGLTRDYDASTAQVRVIRFGIPVCSACQGHALRPPVAQILIGMTLVLGLVCAALGIGYAVRSSGSSGPPVMIVVGAAVTVAAIAGVVIGSRRSRQGPRREPGHHPHLHVTVAFDRIVVVTRNDTLADDLVALNRDARRLAEKADGKRIPAARVVGRPGSPGS